MIQYRTKVLALIVLATTGAIAACGSDGGSGSDRLAKPTKIPIGETVTLTVDGAQVPVEPADKYSCSKRGEEVQLSNWSPGTPTPGPTATVIVGKASPNNAAMFGVNGVRFSVAENRPGTTATASKDGDVFVVEGTARSWDVTPELAKKFRITFTCTTSRN